MTKYSTKGIVNKILMKYYRLNQKVFKDKLLYFFYRSLRDDKTFYYSIKNEMLENKFMT